MEDLQQHGVIRGICEMDFINPRRFGRVVCDNDMQGDAWSLDVQPTDGTGGK